MSSDVDEVRITSDKVASAAWAPHIVMVVENCSYPRDVRVRNEAQTLVAAGYTVTVIAPRFAAQPWHEYIAGVQVYRYPIPNFSRLPGPIGYGCEYLWALLASFVLLCFIALRQDFDVVHVHNPPDLLFLLGLFFQLSGKKLVYDHHDLAPEIFAVKFGRADGLIYHLLRALERLSCRHADRVIASNEAYRQIEMDRDGVAPSAITVVRNGPDLETLPDILNLRPLTEIWSRSLAPSPQSGEGIEGKAQAVLCYAGSINTQDNVDKLLRSLAYLIHQRGRRDIICLIIGDGDARPALLAEAERLGIAPYVVFTGWIDDPLLYWRYLRSADIGVEPAAPSPLNNYSTMIKVMEYMAAALPVVAYDLPETRRSAGKAALYVAQGDEVAFAQAIEALLADPERRAWMGFAGRLCIEEEQCWRRSAQALIALYEGLLGGDRQLTTSVQGDDACRSLAVRASVANDRPPYGRVHESPTQAGS
jgi:glycosyltransferase involved in cell wall biosynthesis